MNIDIRDGVQMPRDGTIHHKQSLSKYGMGLMHCSDPQKREDDTNLDKLKSSLRTLRITGNGFSTEGTAPLQNPQKKYIAF
jgi:hypothetical protein